MDADEDREAGEIDRPAGLQAEQAERFDVVADEDGDRGGREDVLDEDRRAGQEAAPGAERAAGEAVAAARRRQDRGQLGEREDQTGVHHAHQQRWRSRGRRSRPWPGRCSSRRSRRRRRRRRRGRSAAASRRCPCAACGAPDSRRRSAVGGGWWTAGMAVREVGARRPWVAPGSRVNGLCGIPLRQPSAEAQDPVRKAAVTDRPTLARRAGASGQEAAQQRRRARAVLAHHLARRRPRPRPAPPRPARRAGAASAPGSAPAAGCSPAGRSRVARTAAYCAVSVGEPDSSARVRCSRVSRRR